MAITNFITVPGDDDVQLKDLQNWALTISWCSNAIIDVFYNADLQNTASTTLRLFRGELTTPETADPDTDYWYYTEPFVLTSGVSMVEKATFTMNASQYAPDVHIYAQTSVNADAEIPDWFTWYDTNEVPANYRCGTEKIAPDDFVSGQVGQVRICIHTNDDGVGGEVNYYAFLTDPDLFKIGGGSPTYQTISGGDAYTIFT